MSARGFCPKEPPKHVVVFSLDMERCVSPERMPLLEPLGAPTYGVVSSLLDPPTTLLAPSREACRDTNQLAAPSKMRLVLENKGNVARDHLASERTYLAYVRTSLACASAGIALMQLLMRATGEVSDQESDLDPLTMFARPLGGILVLFGLVILVFGLVRYFSTQSALVRGYFPVARNSIMMIAFVLGSLVAIVFGVTIAGMQL